jgi:hypothetical protein
MGKVAARGGPDVPPAASDFCKVVLAARASLLAPGEGPGIVPLAMPEPGLITLFKIVGTLLGAMSVVPFLFLLAPGDRTEPTESFDGDVQ